MNSEKYDFLVKVIKLINDFTNFVIFGFFTIFAYAYPEAKILLLPLFIMTSNIFLMINGYINSCTITYSIYALMSAITYIGVTLYVYGINSTFGYHIRSHAINYIIQMNIPTLINLITVLCIDNKIKSETETALSKISWQWHYIDDNRYPDVFIFCIVVIVFLMEVKSLFLKGSILVNQILTVWGAIIMISRYLGISHGSLYDIGKRFVPFLIAWYVADTFYAGFRKKYHMVFHHLIAIGLLYGAMDPRMIKYYPQGGCVLLTHEISAYFYNKHVQDYTDPLKKYLAWNTYFWGRIVLYPLFMYGLSRKHKLPNPVIILLSMLMCFNIIAVIIKRKQVYGSLFSYNRFLKLDQ